MMTLGLLIVILFLLLALAAFRWAKGTVPLPVHSFPSAFRQDSLLKATASNSTSQVLLIKQANPPGASEVIRVAPSEPIVVEPASNAGAGILIGPDASSITVGPQDARVVRPQITIGPNARVVIASSRTTVIAPSREARVIVELTRVIPIEPPQRGAWDERGWTRRTENGHEIYEGFYQAASQQSHQLRRFPGRVIVNRRNVTAYISDPPPEIKGHPHGACFQLYRAPWFQLHWARAAHNVDDAILYMERVLDESING